MSPKKKQGTTLQKSHSLFLLFVAKMILEKMQVLFFLFKPFFRVDHRA